MFPADIEAGMKKIVWVTYNEGGGAVRSVYFREPRSTPAGCRTIKTVLDERDIQRVHQLKVVGEKVYHTYSLGGI